MPAVPLRPLACGVRPTDANFVQMGVVPHSRAKLARQRTLGCEPADARAGEAKHGCLVRTFEFHPRLAEYRARIGKLSGDRLDITRAHATVANTEGRGTAEKVVVTPGY